MHLNMDSVKKSFNEITRIFSKGEKIFSLKKM